MELIKGIAIKTRPDEIHFDKMFKDVLIVGKFIVITDKSDEAVVLINYMDAKKGMFTKTFAPYKYSSDYTKEDNARFEETHNYVIRILQYDENNDL